MRTGGENGMEFPMMTAARTKKGGRVVAARGGRLLQRLGVPRKKKLTSLKMKVSKISWTTVTKMTMTKTTTMRSEKGGKSTIIDHDNIDGPYAKRSRTDGVSLGAV